jgi:hypothetical protein
LHELTRIFFFYPCEPVKSVSQKCAAIFSSAATGRKPGEQALFQKKELLALYRAHQPYHEPLEKLVPGAP